MPHLTRNSLFVTALTCATGLILWTGSASAQTETFVTSSFLGSAAHTTDFVLPSFNASLGTLDSVDVILRVNLCPIITVTNSTDAPISFTNATIDVPVDVTGPGALDLTLDLNASVKSGVQKPGTRDYGLPRQSTDTSTQVTTSDLDLWENQPGNKVSVDLTPLAAEFGGNASASGLSFGGRNSEWGRVTVVYTYTGLAAPEPRGGYLTAIVGLAMLVGVLRRRTAAKA